jgi:hypothetical protein
MLSVFSKRTRFAKGGRCKMLFIVLPQRLAIHYRGMLRHALSNPLYTTSDGFCMEGVVAYSLMDFWFLPPVDLLELKSAGQASGLKASEQSSMLWSVRNPTDQL